MNRSRYIARALDPVDRAICLALSQNARLTIRELARIIGLSSPSATERMRRLEDSGVISGYTITVDNQVVGQPVGVHFRFHPIAGEIPRSEEHTSELQSLMRISYAVFCLKKKKSNNSHI